MFADLDYPDAELREARLRLTMALNQLLGRHLRRNSDAVQKLGKSPAELSDLRHYRLRACPVMRILSIFVALGYDVDLVVRQQGSGRVKVVCEFIRAGRLACVVRGSSRARSSAH